MTDIFVPKNQQGVRPVTGTLACPDTPPAQPPAPRVLPARGYPGALTGRARSDPRAPRSAAMAELGRSHQHPVSDSRTDCKARNRTAIRVVLGGWARGGGGGVAGRAEVGLHRRVRGSCCSAPPPPRPLLPPPNDHRRERNRREGGTGGHEAHFQDFI